MILLAFAMYKIWSWLRQWFTWEHVCDLDLKHIRHSWQDLQEGQLGEGMGQTRSQSWRTLCRSAAG